MDRKFTQALVRFNAPDEDDLRPAAVELLEDGDLPDQPEVPAQLGFVDRHCVSRCVDALRVRL